MFRRSTNSQAIKGDVIGEALVEVRDQIKDHGWRKGGSYYGDSSPMCLGNAVAVVSHRQSGSKSVWYSWIYLQSPWLNIHLTDLGRNMVAALGFGSTEELTSWNDHLHFGQNRVLKRLNEAIENRNKVVVNRAHEAALAENAEREKLYIPSEWKPRTMSGEQREKVTA